MRWLTAILALSTAACDVLSPEPKLVTVEVDSSAIAAHPETNRTVIVPFVVENVHDEPIYLARCADRALTIIDRRDAQGWTRVYSDLCPAVYEMSAARLERGETFVSTRTIAVAPGVFRLRVGTSEDPNGNAEWEAASSGFELQ